MTQKAKSKQLAFASEMQDWISEERWSERIVGMLCVMAGLLNILISMSFVALAFSLGIVILGIYLWWRTSKPEKIQKRLRQRLHQTPLFWIAGGLVVLAVAMVTYASASGLSLSLSLPIGFVRSFTAVIGAFGIQAIWRGWKLSQMQAYYGV